MEIVVAHAGAELGRYTVAPGEYTIGRASTSSIIIKIGPVSRQHARLVVEESGAVAVEDLASANGTHLREQAISGLTAWIPGEQLRIGDVALQLHAIPPERLPDEYAPTLSPSQAGDYEPAPSSETRTVRSEEADIIDRHLPLTDRRAQRLDREKEIARGGMGAVLQARESATRRTVAMKIMLRGENTKETLRFIEEAQVTAQLEHPNIVPVHDLGIDEHGQPFYTMKLVAGINLKKVLELLREGVPETVKKYPLATLLTVFQKVCDALAFAHSRGVIHRDLKPANIMVGKYGEVLVMDWGLAKIVGTKAAQGEDATFNPELSVVSARREESDLFSTMAGSVMGTPHYMSPEQARGEADLLDARSDIFTLGVILYELLALARPFEGKNAREIMGKIVAGEFTPPGAQASSPPKTADAISAGRTGRRPLLHLPGGRIPESLDAIVRKAMALDPAARYPRVTALQADLTAYQTGFATSAETRSAWKQVKLLIKRHQPASIGIAAVLLVGATVGTKAILEGRRAEREAVRANAALAALRRQAPALRQFAESEAGFQRFDSALEKLDAALALDPAHLPSYWRRSWLFIGMDRMADAAAALRLAQQKDPAHGTLAAILPTVEKLAALRQGQSWPADSARELYEHLVKVAASGEIVAIAPKAKLSGKENEKLVRKRLDEWLGKGTWGLELDTTGVMLHVHLHGLPIDTLEPLRGLRIHSINMGNTTKVSSLEPLRGMQLTSIILTNCRVSDLSPLVGMPLTEVQLGGTRVTDLSPLRGAPLKDLQLAGLGITDYSPLKGAPLRVLSVAGNPISDLSFLSEAPLDELVANQTAITDLTPLRGKPLKKLVLSKTKISGLSPLLGAPLEELDIGNNPGINDLTLLLTFPKLEKLRVSKLGKLLEPLRKHPSLKQIAYDEEPYRPVAEFWAEYDAQQAAGRN